MRVLLTILLVHTQKGNGLYCQRFVSDPGSETSVARRKATHKILWASRIAIEKRPQLLIEIARLLLSLKPDFIIEVWGATGNLRHQANEETAEHGLQGGATIYLRQLPAKISFVLFTPAILMVFPQFC